MGSFRKRELKVLLLELFEVGGCRSVYQLACLIGVSLPFVADKFSFTLTFSSFSFSLGLLFSFLTIREM